MTGMKKILTIIGAAIAISACTKIISLSQDDGEPVFCVSACFTTDEAWHEVYLCNSGKTTISRLSEKATVSCYVNGSLAAIADSLRYDNLFQVHAFKADFHSDDLIRIEVRLDGKSLYSEFCVPPAPDIHVDTLARKDTYGNTFYESRMTVKDASKGDSFYMLFNNDVYIEVRETRNGSVIKSGRGSNVYRYPQDDPVLEIRNEDFFSQLSDEELDGTVVYGGVPLFRDISFPGDSYSFACSHYLKHSRVLIRDGINDDWWIRCTISFSIGALSESFYHELRRHNGTGDDLLSEPYLNKDNVIGGVGYCGIINISRVDITFPDFSGQ